jgi:hypothetical protein
MKHYRKCVDFYFESEYSDIPLDQVVEQIRVFQIARSDSDELIPTTVNECNDLEAQRKLRAKWERKIKQIVRSYYEADKPPPEAAQKLAKILSAYINRPLLDEP